VATGRTIKIAVPAFGAIALIAASTAQAARPTPGTIGMNLNGLYSAGEEIPFIDVFKMSAPWALHKGGSPNAQGEPALDSNGWVTTLSPGDYAETSIFTGSTGHYPAGSYTLTYEGKGTLEVRGAGVTVTSQTPGHMVLDVKPSPDGRTNGIQIRETATDPAAPIRNIRVFLPGFTAEPKGNPFNPAFIALLRPFKLIRFIGWSHVNRSETEDWSDARPVTYATQASGVTILRKLSGVALEYQIQLANLLHADPWFLVPLKANDDYVRRMAALIHQQLDPGLHPYVELSNEVWNDHFPEAAYAKQRGSAAGLDADPTKALVKWYTGQAVHVFDIWRDVYGPDAPRIVRVLGSAYSLPPVTITELSYPEIAQHVDALAIAPYITPKILRDYDAMSRMTPDEVLDAVEADVTHKFRDFAGYHLATTKKYSVDLIAYEGGPGLMSAGAPPNLLPLINQTLLTATRSPRMAKLYHTLLDEWFQLGGVAFNHFVDCSPPSNWGDFGMVEYQTEDPKSSEIFEMLSTYRPPEAR